jgi:hypothetical protein
MFAKWILVLLNRMETNETYEGETPSEVFISGFYQRSRRYVVLCLLIVSLFAIDSMSGRLSVPFQGYGVLIDLVGALALASSVVRGTRGIFRDTRTHGALFAGGGASLVDQGSLASEVNDTIDGIWGTTLLLTGFIVQFVAIVLV